MFVTQRYVWKKFSNNIIKHVFEDEELEINSTVANFATVQTEGSREVKRNIDNYNLDVGISVGYRVKSLEGVRFRKWATERVKEYIKRIHNG